MEGALLGHPRPVATVEWGGIRIHLCEVASERVLPRLRTRPGFCLVVQERHRQEDQVLGEPRGLAAVPGRGCDSGHTNRELYLGRFCLRARIAGSEQVGRTLRELAL